VSVMAPTGTISFAMDCAATSIEPFFSHVVYKKLSGGGYMVLANPVIGQGLKKLGYTDEEISEITEYIMREDGSGMILDGKIEGAPHLREEDLAVFDTANQCGTGERYIHYLGHVRMVAAITPLISGAISKTVNLPPSLFRRRRISYFALRNAPPIRKLYLPRPPVRTQQLYSLILYYF